MVRVLTIKTVGDLTNAIQVLNRIKRRLPQMTRKGMMRWGKILERDMRLSAIRARIGRGINNSVQGKGIEWRQRIKGNIGYLFIRRSLVFLDSMKAHFVSITRRRTRLLAWAKRARYAWIRKGANLVSKGARRGKRLFKFSIFVRPHPFISNGFRRARPKLRPVLRRLAIRAVHEA